MTILAESLLELAASARHEFVMCAPFAKAFIVSNVLAVVPAGTRVALYTRWRPDEVAAGVSDTAVLPILHDRGGAVYLHDRLHAKYYRSESHVLVGSANLTATALGWGPSPNLELLVTVDNKSVRDLEDRLQRECMVATYEVAREVEELAKLFAHQAVSVDLPVVPATADWAPALRIPSDLFVAYRHGAESLSSTASSAAVTDLQVLDLPPGLDRTQFYALVAHRLRGQPFFTSLGRFIDRPRRFGEVRDMLADATACDRDAADRLWQTAMRWILEFLPESYRRSVSSHTEVISPTADTSGDYR